MSVEISVTFRILAFEEHPDSVTKLLRVTPKQIWVKGQKRHPKTILVHQENGWELNSGLPPTVELEQQAGAIMNTLLSARDTLTGMDCVKVLSVAVSIYGDDRPALNFSAGLVQAIASVGASIDVDVIYYP